MAKEEIPRLHYKEDEKIFPFEKYVTKLKEKGQEQRLTGKQQVNIFLCGIRSTNTSIQSAKVNIFQNFHGNFDEAAEFLSSLITNLHASVQLKYANRHAGNIRQYVSAMGSNDQCDGRSSASKAVEALAVVAMAAVVDERCIFANINVNITDPHRNFTSAEWERLGTMQSYVLQLREGGCGGRGREMALTMTMTPTGQPAVLLRPLTTTRPTRTVETIYQLISLLCLTLPSVDLRMAAVLPVLRILNMQLPMACTMCML